MSFPRSGTVDTQTFSGTKDYIFAKTASAINTNISAADHLKFTVIESSRPVIASTSTSGAQSGSSMSLDTTTTFSATSGAASLGRFSLRGGKTYCLTCNPGYVLFSGATGLLTCQFFDVTLASGGVAIGSPKSIFAQTDASHDGSCGQLQAFFTAGGGHNDISLVEVQITVATAITSIGDTAKGLPTILVETY